MGTELTDEGLSLSSADGALINFSYIGFDALGRPLNNAANCGTGSPCRVTITGESSVDVCIESEGYIHASKSEQDFYRTLEDTWKLYFAAGHHEI